MLKKIFSNLCMATFLLFVVSSRACAAEVVIVLDAPIGTFSEPEKVHELIENSLENILGDYRSYEIVPPSETENYVQLYREEHDMIFSTGAEENKQTEYYLKKADVDNICTHFRGKHLIYIRFTSTAPRYVIGHGLLYTSQKTNAVMDFRVWSSRKKDFTYMRRLTAKGSSTAVLDVFPSTSRSLQKGLKKILREIEDDEIKIRVALTE